MSQRFINHPSGKSAKPDRLVNNSLVAEMEKSCFTDRLD